MTDSVSSRWQSGHAFDVIVCGSGASGSVVARRLSDDPDVNVLLIEAGGVDGLTIADGSVFPRIPTGNTMAPCVVIGERASQILRKQISPGNMSGAKREVVV